MGGAESQQEDNPALETQPGNSPSSASVQDSFNATELLRHLQEQEGYEVYDIFEGKHRERVPAPLRQWHEDSEDWLAACPTGSKEPASSSSPLDTDDTDILEDSVRVDLDNWVLLSMPARPKGKAAGKGKGPGKGPRPPGAKGKAPPPPPPKSRPASKAKSRPSPSCPPGGERGDEVPTGDQAASGMPSATPARRPLVGKAPPPPPFGKRLHWKLLPAASLGDTIFEELQPWGEVAPPLDTSQLERLFRPAPTSSDKPASSAATAKSTGAANPGKDGNMQGRVCLLDPKRAQNLAIVLRQVALPTAELCEVLRWMRLSHPVSTEALEHIYDNLLPPLLESQEIFQSYEGAPETLRNIEQQLLPLVKLPRLKARLQSLLFGKNLPSLHADLQARIRSLRDACQQVRDSSTLKRVLGTVLRVGNFLNHGVDAPDAGGGVEVRGFAMESLLRLRDFRASQGGEMAVSALHCVALHLLPAEPQLPNKLREELRAVLEVGADDAATLSIADLKEAVGRFRSEAELVQSEADRFGDAYRLDSKTESERTSPASPGPLETLRRLAEDSSELSSKLEAEMADALTKALRLLEYFGERKQLNGPGPSSVTATSDKEDAAVERFFVVLREFAASLEACWREVLEQPRKLRLDGASSAAATAAAPVSSANTSAKAESDETEKGSRGTTPVRTLRTGLGLLAGEAAVAAAMRRRSRAALPARPAPMAALAAVADAGGAGWTGGRSGISAAAAEVD